MNYTLLDGPDPTLDVTNLDTHVQMSKDECKEILKRNVKELADLQEKLYSSDQHGILLVFQAMDAAGKDSTIKAVFSGMNPQGFKVSSFKQPSKEELSHDYLWRVYRALPERGHIGVFNRSHYEEVLVVRVHPEYILGQDIPGVDSVDKVDDEFWHTRFRQINDFERHLSENGYIIRKFFLNVGREEQKKRFIDRMEEPGKHWKFSLGDLKERQLWDDYMHAYSQAIGHTSSPHAPWYIIPGDDKDFIRASVSSIVLDTLKEMDLDYPEASSDVKEDISEAYKILENED